MNPIAPSSRPSTVRSLRPTGSDDSPQLQAAVDAGPGLVYLSGGTYQLSSPVNIRGRGVRVMGDGVGATTIKALDIYGGSILSIGITPPPPGNFRPLVPAGVYDSSVQGPRYALQTGTVLAAGVGMPLSHGGDNGEPPDYYQGPRAITIDAYLALPGPYYENQFLFGLRDKDGRGNPWQVIWSGGRTVLEIVCGDGTHRVPGGTGGRLGWTFCPADGYGAAWQEKQHIAGGPDPNWPAGGKGYPQSMVYPNGFGPMTVGGGNGSCSLVAGDMAPMTCYGLRVYRGEVYQRGKPTQTLLNGKGLDDQQQFFDGVGPGGLGTLQLTDSGPNLAVDSGGYRCMLRLIGPQEWEDTQDVSIERLTIAGRMQPAILIGQHFGTRIAHCRITGASQAVGCLGVGYGQGLWLEDVTMDGTDASLCLYRQFAACGRNLRLDTIGRDGGRFYGGWGSWEEIVAQRTSPLTRTVFKGVTHADGARWVFKGVAVDNEDRAIQGPSFEFINGEQRPATVRLTDISVAQGSTYPLIRLVGGGPAVSRIETSGLDCAPLLGVALEVVGGGWWGTFDASGLKNDTFSGTGVVVVPKLATADK